MTVASTQTLFDHTLKKAIDTPGTTGAAVYLKDPERAVLLLAAALGQRAASGAPWPGEIAWADGGAAAEPLTDVETDQTTLTVPLLLGEDEIGAVVVSARARVSSGVDTDDLSMQCRALARALAPAPLEIGRAHV